MQLQTCKSKNLSSSGYVSRRCLCYSKISWRSFLILSRFFSKSSWIYSNTKTHTWLTQDSQDQWRWVFMAQRKKLFIIVFTNNEKGLAFEDSEQGTLWHDYFDYIMPVIEHVPWTDCQSPIPTPHVEEVVKLIQTKIDTGVFKPSQASYWSSIFCVPKNNGFFQIVINSTLNSVSSKTLDYLQV